MQRRMAKTKDCARSWTDLDNEQSLSRLVRCTWLERKPREQALRVLTINRGPSNIDVYNFARSV